MCTGTWAHAFVKQESGDGTTSAMNLESLDPASPQNFSLVGLLAQGRLPELGDSCPIP